MNVRYIDDRLRRFYERSSIHTAPIRREDDKVLAGLDRKLQPRIDAFRASTRLTEDDYQLRVNV